MGLTRSRRSVYGHAIGRMGSSVGRRGCECQFDVRYDLVPSSVRADLRHFLFLGHYAATNTRETAAGVAGGPEEGRQGGHGVWYLGHRDESWEGNGDAADRRYDQDSDTTGSDRPIAWRRRRREG